MTETTETETDEAESESTESVNISRFRQMAIKGHEYREEFTFTYYGEEATLYLRPLRDPEFLPIAAEIEERLGIEHDVDDFEEQMDMSTEEAKKHLDEARNDNSIDASEFDEDFVETMHDAAALGIDTSQGAAEGESEEGVREILKMLQGGKSLVIAERVLEMSSDAEKAEKFRRDGGGQ